MKQSIRERNNSHGYRGVGLPTAKCLLAWIMTAIVCLGILPAQAQETETETIRFTVNVPFPEAVTCTIMGIDHPLSEGPNVFELASTTTVYFAPVYPWKFTTVKDKAGKKPSGFYGTDWYLYVDSNCKDEEYSIEMVDINDLRTAQFTLNVDEPSLVSAIMNGYNTVLDLVPGENIVKYEPNVETYLNLSPSNNITPFYSVKLNGTTVAPQGLIYGVALRKDCVIDVTAILPDEQRTVTFSYTSGAQNSITLLVNDEEVTQFDGNTLAVRLGDKLTIQARNTYKVNKVSINGLPIDFYGIYSFNVMKDTQIHIDAKPYDTISATVIVNDPELIAFSSNSQSLDLTAGENIIQLPETNTTIMWTVSPAAILNSVTVNGNVPLPAYQNSYTLERGDVIAFEVVPKVFDMKAIVWIDNATGKACSNYLDLSSQTDRSVRYTFENGYNIVDFYEAMNPFALSWGGYDPEDPEISLKGKAYLNGSPIVSEDGESIPYNIVTLADGDVLKLFMDSEPETCHVAFDISEGVEATVVKDILTTVENPSDGFECFAGTQISVSGHDIKVTVDGKEPSFQEDVDGTPTYTFTAESPSTTVMVTNAGNSVDHIGQESDSDIYDIQGKRLGSRDSIKSLAPGIYIIRGQKAVVTRHAAIP